MVRAATVTPSTPVRIQTRRQVQLGTSSPPTPHRIELRSESTEENISKNNLICQPPAPKSRKKLPTSHICHQNNNITNTNDKIAVKTNTINNSQKNSGQQKLTDFFPVRRSVRKTKTTVLEEKNQALENLVRNRVEEGLEIRLFDGKGRGVVAAKEFFKGDFVVEYSGELVDILEAKEREEEYAQNENAGCYMYYFKHNGSQYCIDATAETGRLGRLVNHSRNNPNLVTKTILVDKKPRLVLIAKENIKIGEEVLYDYGDRSKESLQHHPWLAL